MAEYRAGTNGEAIKWLVKAEGKAQGVAWTTRVALPAIAYNSMAQSGTNKEHSQMLLEKVQGNLRILQERENPPAWSDLAVAELAVAEAKGVLGGEDGED